MRFKVKAERPCLINVVLRPGDELVIADPDGARRIASRYRSRLEAVVDELEARAPDGLAVGRPRGRPRKLTAAGEPVELDTG